MIIYGNLSYGQLIALVAYCSVTLRPFESYVTFLSDITQYGTYVKRYEDAFGQFKSSNRSNKNIDDKKQDIINEECNEQYYLTKKPEIVSFSGVRVDYQKETTSLDFILKGQTAILGLSGEGKTTIAQLLFREKEPIAGEILIDNKVNLNTIVKNSWIGSIAALGQDEEIFNDDLEYNILMGKRLIRKSEMKSEYEKMNEQLEKFLKYDCEPKDKNLYILAWYYDLVENGDNNLRNKKERFREYATSSFNRIVDNWISLTYVEKERYESIIEQLDLNKIRDRNFGQGGATISGGEKQRISLARFLLKPNFDFYILDEPFTAMDALLESKCTILLKEKIRNKLGIIITHKIHLAEALSENIVLINNGNANVTGSALELIEKSEMYKKLRETYFKNVKEKNSRL